MQEARGNIPSGFPPRLKTTMKGITTMHTSDMPLLVGIDLAKDSFTAAVGHQDAEVICTFALTEDGLARFLQFLDGYGSFPEGFVFGLEASGPYTALLLNWLLSHGARPFLLNPLLIYRFRRAQSLRRTKTDAIDARTIVQYMAQAPQDLQPFQEDDDVQVLAHEYEHVAQQVARLKTQLRQQLHALFPELASSSSLFSLRVLRVLLRFPSAYALVHADPEQLAAVWSSTRPASGRGLALTWQRLQEMARSSIGLHAPQREIVLQSKIRQLLHLLEEQKTLRDTLVQAVRDAHPQTWRILLSVPGLGPLTVALFLTHVRSLDRFPSHRQLAAFAGIDPTTYESGQYKAQGHISKRGSPHLRRVLYLMAQAVIRRTQTFGHHFDQLKARGKAYRVAVIACANKLLRVIFALVGTANEFIDSPTPEVSHS
jgi:transposase